MNVADDIKQRFNKLSPIFLAIFNGKWKEETLVQNLFMFLKFIIYLKLITHVIKTYYVVQ